MVKKMHTRRKVPFIMVPELEYSYGNFRLFPNMIHFCEEETVDVIARCFFYMVKLLFLVGSVV